jgi:membrane dipeptidase
VIIDGHNDLVLHRWRGEPTQHLDLDAARDAGFAGGFFALYIPSPRVPDPTEIPYAVPLPAPIPHEEAARIAEELFAELCALPVVRATSADDFRDGQVTAIVHMEGAEPIAADLSNLEEWYDRGLRSIGLVWSRSNDFAEGVPFRFPSSPDIGAGLTAAGRELVQACNRLGILVDLSHLNEAGFWEVAGLSDAPLVATHSNAHALCAASRNLLDTQLDAIRDSNGIVGVNFAVTFLREDGSLVPETPISEIVRHIDYLVERMGIDHVAFGSDFDGAVVPEELGGAAGLPKLVAALQAAGYDDAAVAKITHENWLRVLRATWRDARRSRAPSGSAPARRPG